MFKKWKGRQRESLLLIHVCLLSDQNLVQQLWPPRYDCGKCCWWNNFLKFLKKNVSSITMEQKKTNKQRNQHSSWMSYEQVNHSSPARSYTSIGSLHHLGRLIQLPGQHKSIPDFREFSFIGNRFLECQGGNIKFSNFLLIWWKTSLFPFYYLISVLNDNLQCLAFEHQGRSKGKRRRNMEGLVNIHSTTNSAE